MNVIQFSEGTCAKIRKYLDYYLSNELSVETNHEVMRHLENCKACSDDLNARARLKNRLQVAARRESVPPYLQEKIQRKIRESKSNFRVISAWGNWAIAAAVVALFTVGGWVAVRWWKGRVYTDPRAQAAFIQRLSAGLPGIATVGLADHVHCAVLRKYPQQYPALPVAVEQLGPKYLPLVSLVRARVPNEFRVILAHRCRYGGRQYVHLVLKSDSALMSVVITDKLPGDSFKDYRLVPSSDGSGVPIYQVRAQHFEVAGFKSQNQLAFVVSDLSQERNLQIAASLAPPLTGFLNGLEG